MNLLNLSPPIAENNTKSMFKLSKTGFNSFFLSPILIAKQILEIRIKTRYFYSFFIWYTLLDVV